MTAIGSAYTASYDAAGNMTCRAPSSASTCAGTPTGAQLTFDNEGRLSAWQNAPSNPTSTTSNLYDGAGTRVEQQVTSGSSGSTTVYVGNVEEVSTSAGATITTTSYYTGGQRIAQAVNGVFSYLGSDGLGSALVSLDANGNVQASILYDPYGNVRYVNGAMPGSYGFTGQHADGATGLDDYGARYYDPVAGQFTSADSVADGLNRYGYVAGNPETRTDPSGHKIDCGVDCTGGSTTCASEVSCSGGYGGGGTTPTTPTTSTSLTTTTTPTCYSEVSCSGGYTQDTSGCGCKIKLNPTGGSQASNNAAAFWTAVVEIFAGLVVMGLTIYLMTQLWPVISADAVAEGLVKGIISFFGFAAPVLDPAVAAFMGLITALLLELSFTIHTLDNLLVQNGWANSGVRNFLLHVQAGVDVGLATSMDIDAAYLTGAALSVGGLGGLVLATVTGFTSVLGVYGQLNTVSQDYAEK